jgi:diacylglycerol kinase (ATP)
MTVETGQRKRVVVILNGISLRKKHFYNKIVPALSDVADITVWETRSRKDAIALGAQAKNERFEVVLSAGGDGTLHQVVNGLLKESHVPPTTLPVLGIIPIGSGNDFARAQRFTDNARELATRLQRFETRRIDLGKIVSREQGTEQTHYFINIADVGMGPEVVKRLNESDRLFGSAFSYYSAIIKNFFTYKPITLTVTSDRESWQGKIRTFAIANGKYFGHGLCVAPSADDHDGQFETFLCGDVSVLDFIRYSGTLKNGKYIRHPKVQYSHGTTFELSSAEPASLEADGEVVGSLPAKVTLMPQAISLLI